MKAEELCLGNLIWDKDHRICKVCSLQNEFDDENQIQAWPIDRGAMVSLPFEPIPLTEEWLIRFGAKYDVFKKKSYLDSDFIEVERLIIDNTWCFKERHIEFQSDDFFFGRRHLHPLSLSNNEYLNSWYISNIYPVFNVHQLQNLYFALTGEELELKNKEPFDVLSEKYIKSAVNKLDDQMLNPKSE